MPWITTKSGKKVNTDWFDKDRQIAENKKEADARNGSYEEWNDKRAKKEYSKYDYDVTSKEWKNATQYVGGRYSGIINAALYEGNMIQKTMGGEKIDVSPYIKELDKSMRPLSSNVTLSRSIVYTQWKNSLGVDFDTVQKITEAGDKNYKALDKVIGKSFTPKGFLSTSYNEEQNATVGGQVLLKLKTPAGKKAIVTDNKLESEVILERNTTYTITGYDIKQIAGTRKQIVFYADVKRGN